MNYTSQEQKVVEKIRHGYEEHEITNTERVKQLDRQVRRPAEIFAYAFGAVGALVFGTGMSLAMKVIGAGLHPAIGIAVGIGGMGICVANYFLYQTILKGRKKKYASQILSLCNEALNEENK